MTRLSALLALPIGLVAAMPAAAKPLTLYPANPHYFQFRGKPTVLVGSGEHYGAVLNLDFDYIPYLDELKRHGLNQTRTFSGSYVENWGEGWNTLNPVPNRYIAPWARSSQPGYIDGGNKFDLSKWDDAYFRRLKDFVAQAGRRGIVVEFVLFCTNYDDGLWDLSPLNARNNVNGIGRHGRAKAFDVNDGALMAAHEALARKVAGELKGFDNVYYELVNEAWFDYSPRIGDPWNGRTVKAIHEAAPDALIAIDVASGSQKVDKVPDGVGVLHFHYSSPPDSVAMNAHHKVPVGFDETGFRGPGADPYRREAWEFLLAGGALYSNLDWSFTVDSETGHSTASEDRLGPKDPAIRPQLGALKRFMDRLPFHRMRPAPETLSVLPAGASARVLAEWGKAYAAYVSGGSELRLKMELPKGRYTVEWLDPKTGRAAPRTRLQHAGGAAELAPPAYDGEAAVSILRAR